LLIWLQSTLVSRRVVEVLGQGRSNLIVHKKAVFDDAFTTLKDVRFPYTGLGDPAEMAELRPSWSGRVRRRISSPGAPSLGPDRSALDPRIRSILAEDLSHIVVPGCLDAIVATRAILQDGSPRITAVLSDRYPGLQWPVVAWWLALLRMLQDQGVAVEMVRAGDTTASPFCAESQAAVVDSHNGSSSPLHGRWSEAIDEAGGRPVVYWAGGVRRAGAWERVLRDRHPDATGVLRLSNATLLYTESACGGPLALLSCNWASDGDGLVELTNSACARVQEAVRRGSDFDFELLAAAAADFLVDVAARRWMDRVSTVSGRLGEVLGQTCPMAVYAVDTPIMEATAVMDWSLRLGIRPDLLPHSFLSRHPIFPRQSYGKALVYFSSVEITPRFEDAPPDPRDEERIDPQGLRWGRPQVSDRRESELSAAGIHCGERGGRRSLARLVRRSVRDFRNRLVDRRRHASEQRAITEHLRAIGNHQVRLGYLLSWELHHFTTEVDVVGHAVFVAGLANEVATGLHEQRAALVVRGKPRFTHPRVFEAGMSTWSGGVVPRNLFFSPIARGLSGFGSDVDLVLATQGSSAHIELMLEGVPTVRLEHAKAPVFLSGEGYMGFPEHVVPSMTLGAVLDRIESDPGWAGEEGRRQQEWARSQKAPTLDRDGRA
jgi:hypothetical protein